MVVSTYRRRQPEKTLLYNVIREHLHTFLEAADRRGGGPLPKYVRQEFFRFLKCGILAHGLARVRCPDCGHDTVVGFSCKGRGFCPSCGGRRMAQTAAHLVDRVFPPEAPVRQWVLSMPRRIRYCLTKDARLLSGTVSIWMEEVFRHLSRQYAFQKLGVDGRRLPWRYRRRLPQARQARCGGVTAIQRFGSSLNCHVHLHSLVLDGVYVRDPGSGRPSFLRVPEPEPEDLEILLARVIRRVTRYLSRRGCIVEEPDGMEAQTEPGVLEILQAASIGGWEGLSNAPRPVPVVGRRMEKEAAAPRALEHPFTAEKDGWSVHAGAVVEAGRTEKLEKVCRYLLRPPFAEERLSRLPDGRIAYGFRKPRWDGGLGIVLEPVEFLAKLAALVPPPRSRAIRYHGLLGPCGGLRREVLPTRERADGCAKAQGRGGSSRSRSGRVEGEDPAPPPEGPSRGTSWIDWAALLRRTFGLDVLSCPRRGGRMRVIALITEAGAIRKILRAMKLPPEIPRPLPTPEVLSRLEAHDLWYLVNMIL